MGDKLYEALIAELPAIACRVYAPVGGHRDLLAYLVRRLLENGANSSFVSAAADPAYRSATILRRPQSWIADRASRAASEDSAAARSLFAGAAQFDGCRVRRQQKLRGAATGKCAPHAIDAQAAPLVDGIDLAGIERAVISPIDGTPIGHVHEGDDAIALAAMAAATPAFLPGP